MVSRPVILLCVALIICIESTQLICDRLNEEYRCDSACQTTCQTLGQPCLIINIRCTDNCYCREGYARETNDTSPCISVKDCITYDER